MDFGEECAHFPSWFEDCEVDLGVGGEERYSREA